MTNFLLVSLLVFGSFATPVSRELPKNPAEKFKLEELTKDGRTAYKSILKAEQFNVSYLSGVAAIPKVSPFVKDVNVLLDEKEADKAFKSLLRNASVAGQLYGLTGLYFTDHQFFKKAVETYRNSDKQVLQTNGCLIGREKVAKIVFSKSEYVAIINPTETLTAWQKSVRGRKHVFDIANGGYPAQIKSLGKNKK